MLKVPVGMEIPFPISDGSPRGSASAVATETFGAGAVVDVFVAVCAALAFADEGLSSPRETDSCLVCTPRNHESRYKYTEPTTATLKAVIATNQPNPKRSDLDCIDFGAMISSDATGVSARPVD